MKALKKIIIITSTTNNNNKTIAESLTLQPFLIESLAIGCLN
jgi:hypothetical protein